MSNIDFSSLQNSSIIPVGIYTAEVISAETRKGKASGDPYINWGFKIVDPTNSQTHQAIVFMITSFSQKALSRTASVLSVLKGYNINTQQLQQIDIYQQDAFKDLFKDCLNQQFKIQVVHDDWRGDIRAKVERVFSIKQTVLIPAGIYTAEVVQTEIRDSKSSPYSYINWDFLIIDPTNTQVHNNHVFMITSLAPKALDRTATMLSIVAGYTITTNQLQQLDLTQNNFMIGKRVQIEVIHKDWQGKTTAQVDQILSANVTPSNTISQSFSTGTPPNTILVTPSAITGLLHHRFLIDQVIGDGGFGIVYKGFDTSFDNDLVAIKQMSLDSNSSHVQEEALLAFKAEAKLLKRLQHPQLPRILDYFSELGYWFLVMDYIEGETLESYLGRQKDKKLPVKEVVAIIQQLCPVLEYLHYPERNIIFRDLKPANVMRTSQGKLFLIDFGIARLFKSGQTKDTSALGSPGFAAPEQYGKTQSDARTDIYGLGATLYYLLTGDDPADHPMFFYPLPSYLGAPLELNNLIQSMVAIDPNKRPQNVRAVRYSLMNIQQKLL